MVSIHSSSYGVSALVSSQMPAASRNGEANPVKPGTSGNEKAGTVESAVPADGKPETNPLPDGPPSGSAATADSTDHYKNNLLLGHDDTVDYEQPEHASADDFEAAARYLLDSVDLREEDEIEEFVPNSNGITFDEAGTYKPAWIK